MQTFTNMPIREIEDDARRESDQTEKRSPSQLVDYIIAEHHLFTAAVQLEQKGLVRL